MTDPSMIDVENVFDEIRENIVAVRAFYPEKTDREIALALLNRSNDIDGRGGNKRTRDLLGMVGTVLAFATRPDGR